MTKTGIKSIQDTLEIDYDLLKKNNILFPVSELHEEFIINSFHVNPHKASFNKKSNLSLDEVLLFAEKQKENISQEILESSQETVVISAEVIISFPKQSMKALKDFLIQMMPNAKIKVIISTRDFVDFTASSLQQRTKDIGGNIDEYINLRNVGMDFTKRFGRCIDIFGKESIIIYKFEDACEHEYGVVGYFLQLIGINKSDIKDFNIEKRNQSISNKAVELIIYINTAIPKYKDNKLAEGRTGDDTILLHKIRGEKFKLDKKTLLKIKDITDKEKQYVKEHFGIDYITNEKEYITSDKIIYDINYYEDITSIYPNLTDTIKRLVYDYIREKLSKETNRTSRKILEKLLKWIKKEYAYITKYSILRV